MLVAANIYMNAYMHIHLLYAFFITLVLFPITQVLWSMAFTKKPKGEPARYLYAPKKDVVLESKPDVPKPKPEPETAQD